MVASPRLWFSKLMWSYGMKQKLRRKLRFFWWGCACFIFKEAFGLLYKKLLFVIISFFTMSLTNILLWHFVHCENSQNQELYTSAICDQSQIRFWGNTGILPPITNSAEFSFFSRTTPLYCSFSLNSVLLKMNEGLKFSTSVVDPWIFISDLDPRIRDPDRRIRI